MSDPQVNQSNPTGYDQVSNGVTNPAAASVPDQVAERPVDQTSNVPAAPAGTPSAPTPQAQPQGNQPIVTNKPVTPAASMHARLFDSILSNLSGGPIKVLQSDPVTGDTREVTVPQSRRTMANSVVAGVLASLFSGSQGRGAEPDYKPVMGSTGTQHAEQQKAAQDKIDQMQDRKMKVVKSNMDTITSQLAAARMGDEVMDKQIADGKTIVDLGREYDKNKDASEPQSIQQENLTHDAALDAIKNSRMQYIAVPSGKTSHLDPATGKMVTEPTYSIVDPHVKVKLSEDDVKMLASTNPSWADAWKQSGGNIEIPLDVVNSERLVRSKANNVQAGINQITSDPVAAKALGFDPSKAGKLMDIMQDKNLRDAVANTEAQMAAHAGSDRHYSILDAMLTSDGGPALAAKLGIDPAKANAWLDQEHRDRIAADKLAEGGLGDKAPMPGAADALQKNGKALGLTPAQIDNAVGKVPPQGLTVGEYRQASDKIQAQANTNAQVAANKEKESGDPKDIDTLSDQLLQPNNLTSMRDIGTRGTQREAIIAEAARKAKERGIPFDIGLTNERIDFAKSYFDPKGKDSMNRRSLNNLVQHSGNLSELNHGVEFKAANTALNLIESQFGNEAYQKYLTEVAVVKDEVSNYFAGGFAPNKEQKATWDNILANNATPNQVESFVKTIIPEAAVRLDSTAEIFKEVMGYDDPNLVYPATKTSAQKLGLGKLFDKYKSGGQLGQNLPATQPYTPVNGDRPINKGGKTVGYLSNDGTRHNL